MTKKTLLLYIGAFCLLQLTACSGDQHLAIKKADTSPALLTQQIQNNLQTDPLTKFVQQMQSQKDSLDFQTVLNNVKNNFVIRKSTNNLQNQNFAQEDNLSPSQSNQFKMGPSSFHQRANFKSNKNTSRSKIFNQVRAEDQAVRDSDLNAISILENNSQLTLTIDHVANAKEVFSGEINSQDSFFDLNEVSLDQVQKSNQVNEKSVAKEAVNKTNAKIACLDNSDFGQCSFYLILVVQKYNAQLVDVRPYLFMKILGQVANNPDNQDTILEPKVLDSMWVSSDVSASQMTLRLNLNIASLNKNGAEQNSSNEAARVYVSDLFTQKDIQAGSSSSINLRPQQIGNLGSMKAIYFNQVQEKWLEFKVLQNKTLDISIKKDFNLLSKLQ